MTTTYMAELAALGTSLCWSFSSVLFTVGTQRVGPMAVNRLRLLFAVLMVGPAHLILYGSLFPLEAGSDRYLWLALSAGIGLVLGDSLLFWAYRLIGTRLGMLMLALNPIFGALFGWLLLGEHMALIEVGAMGLALSGAAWVIMERVDGNGKALAQGRNYAVGLLAGLGAAVCQALGLIVAKPALSGEFPALSAVMIRMTTGMLVMWIWAATRGQIGETVQMLRRDHRAELAILGGSFMGPFVGVWLSLVAVQSARVGVASTLMAMSPIMLLPLVHWVFKEQISSRATGGTLLAMAGIGLMLLS